VTYPLDVERLVPGWRVLRHYRRDWLRSDLLAGLALTALLVPQGMAYAELAGLPAVTGLYTTITALCSYAIFGPSRILVLGPDSALAPLILAAITPLVVADNPDQAVALAGVLALLIGVCCLLVGLIRLGNIAELLSRPVRVGYLNGLALIIVASQLPKLFGFDGTGDDLVEDLRSFVTGVRDGLTEPAALVIGAGCLVVILALREWSPAIPGVLLAIIGASMAVVWFDLGGEIDVVGVIPSGFPAPSLPRVDADQLAALVAAAIGIAFVTLADTSALSKSLAAQRREEVEPNQEIAALGLANITTSLFQGFPVSASMSRTAVAATTGSRTQVTGIVGAGSVIAILLFATSLFEDLPSSALAAVVIAAGITLFDFGTMRWFWKVRRSELALSLGALIGVALLGPLVGIVVAVALSLGNFVRRARRPYDAVLGRIDGRKGYHDRERHPEAKGIPGLLLYRFDAPLFFGNADHLRQRVLELVDESSPSVYWVVLAAEPITDIDTTGAEALEALLDDFDERGIRLGFAELKGPTKDRLRSYRLYERIGDDLFFPTIGKAINAYLEETDVEWTDWTDRDESDEPDGSAGG
jgi:high affinity sulfate transporter 1